MNHHKPFAWIVASISLIVLGGLALLPGATVRSAAAQPPSTPAAPTEMQAIAATGDPVSIKKDAEGYTVWTYEYPGSWCVMYSRIRWPFNLGTQDPTDLSETTLDLTFAEQPYVLGPTGEPLYTNPTWAVALNGKPGAWTDGSFTGEWNVIGAVGTTPTRAKIPVEQPVPFDYTELIDGENNLWFQQQDFCNCSGLADCACTCYELSKLQLRARVDLAVKSVSPEPDTRNVWPDQSKDSEIRVKFTTLVSPTTVNKETFQVYYFDKDVYKVYVEGEIKRISDVEFAFVPATELLPGVRYVAQVWGESDAQSNNHSDWVKDLNGGPLEEGQLWTFWTLPDIQVTVKPVQVLEGMALVQGKPTVLRTFIRWDTPPGVFWKSGVPTVQIDDVIISWLPPGGTTWLSYSWRQDSANNPEFWKPTMTAETARHKREYREFTFPEESYSLLEKRRLQDSFNFFGFTPREMGVYQFKVDVIVKDNLGKEHRFPASAQGLVFVQDTSFPVYMQAVAVGSAYGRTGTVDWSAAVRDNLDRLRALYPVARVNWPAAPSAMAYYSPTTTGWTVEWVNPPSWPYYPSELYLLREMNQLCIRTTGCRAMVGLTPMGWLHVPGTSLREEAPLGALIRADPWNAKRYTAAHEIAHLAHIDAHYEGPSGNGFDVAGPDVKNAEQGEVDFMAVMPEEVDDKSLWITNQHYTTLWQWIHGGIPPSAPQRVASADPLLVVDGIITPTTDAVTLLPWYQLAPGDYVAPTPGPYQIVFLDAAQQEIVSYTRSFTASGVLAFFNFATPYPAATAKVQIRRAADNAVLAEVTPAATPPTLTLHAPAAVWSGPQPLAWDGGSSARYFAVDISTDGGATWVAQAFNLTAPTYTLQTTALPNTTQAFFRVAASDGLRTATATAGPFTIDNPPLVGYVEPPDGAANVGIWTTVAAGFRDAMAPTSINGSTFTLAGGPFGSVRGNVGYDAATHTATFTPTVPLAYATRYTATLTTGVQGANGKNLPVARTWTFTTTLDVAPPSPIALSPEDGAMNVPRNVVLAVAWDRALNASTLNTSTFVLATASGTPVSGVVTYDAAARTAAFTPAAALMTDTLYIATLKAGIASANGYTTTGDLHWAFTTGRAPGGALAFAGGHADWGQDTNGDGLYEQLVIRVGVQVTATGSYVLRGSLAGADGSEITWAYITPTLTVGAHFLDLAFDGAAIGGHGADGPYTLTDLTLTYTSGGTSPQVLASTSQRDAYRTFAYAAARFPAPLRFGGLPDVQILPGTTALNAFNVHDYVQHASLPSDRLSYTVMLNTQPDLDAALQPSGAMLLSPEPYWQGSAAVTIRATDGVNAVQDTFRATVGWPATVYLPVVLRNPGAPVSRDGWLTFLKDGFESESFGWGRSSWYSNLPPEPMRWYFWGQRDCRAYSGQSSAWAYGYSNDGPLPPCGATYPDMLGTRMYQSMPFNLKYVAKAEYSTKVWANLAAGDRVCLQVATDAPDNNCQWATYHDGVCRSGQTNGWEDLTLDLSNVPTLGNLLGKDQVCLAVVFQADKAGTRPEGAYVDDVQLRACPAGLTGNCAGSAHTVPTTPTLAAGNIGGYPESVGEVALAVDAAGRIYALWTGKLNQKFDDYVFYSTSTNGVNWTPYQILSYWGGREPRIAVDNVHGRVHLAYANTDGIIHRTVVNGVVSAPVVVVPSRQYYLPNFPLSSGGLGWPDIAVAENSGNARLVWQEGYYLRTGPYTYAYRYRAWYADWNGTAWSAPQQKINDLDTSAVSIETTADGRAMMAWFQRWEQSAGNGTGPGDPIVARTAYGTEPGSFPLRQATHALYTTPERDESILMAYSGGDDAFVLASDHLMWLGHSRIYRYVWKNGAWSEPVSVAGNTSGWATPDYVGAAKNTPLIRYIYSDNDVLKMRTETNGVLGAAQTVATYLAARGYSGSPLAYFTDAVGNLHMVVSGEKNGVAGFYYVRP